jgi:arylsulfatase A-like enzyme
MIIRPEQTTIADIFRQAGYTTGAIGKWHLGIRHKTRHTGLEWFHHTRPTDIGFDYS